MNYIKKAEINMILSKCSSEIPIIRHKWNDFALELWIEEPDHADEVKERLYHGSDELLKGVMMVFKWNKGEKVVVF